MAEQAARRHHYVPQFLLRRFCSESGPLHALDTGTGQPFRVGPRDAAVIKDYYRYELADGTVDNSIEGLLAEVEGQAAEILRKLKTPPHRLTPDERGDFAMFLSLQYTRTPFGQGVLLETTRVACQQLFDVGLRDPAGFPRNLEKGLRSGSVGRRG